MTAKNRLVIFDLDGVLVDTKDIHYDALNFAIRAVAGREYEITREEHLSTYDGLSTKTKLAMLEKAKGLSPVLFGPIEFAKRVETRRMLEQTIVPNPELTAIFDYLKEEGYYIAVASNAISETIFLCLEKLELDCVDWVVSNETVDHKKPHPEMYWNCMIELDAHPSTTLIIEDSAIGREGAYASGANVWPLNSMKELTLENIKKKLAGQKIKPSIWEDDEMVVLIPMAGAGSRFADAGYTFPKPLIEVRGKPMIQVVTENLGIKAKFVYIVQKAHYEKYNLKNVLNLITPGCEIVQTEGLTSGAACTTLLAKEFIDNGKRLVIANSDQVVDWNPAAVLYSLVESGNDGGILTFKSTHPKWSYARLDENGFVAEVAEKKPISDNATVGIYYWKHGSDYVKYAEQMIAKDIRTNNEFYVCPVFNEAIGDGKKIVTREVDAMWGIGTPEDLNYYLTIFDGEK